MTLVKMVHTDAEATGGPLTADVPESAVHIWLECGWRRAPEAEAAPVQEESAPVQEEGAPASEESAPVQEATPAPAPERKRGRKKAAAPAA